MADDPFGGRQLSAFVWIQHLANSLATYPRVLDRGYSTQFSLYLRDVYYPTINLGMAIVGQNGSADLYAAGAPFQPGAAWFSAGWRYDGSRVDLFVNGIRGSTASAPYGPIARHVGNMRIGQRIDGSLNRGAVGNVACLIVDNVAWPDSAFSELHTATYG
ncbi:MAG: hypothetical protein ABFC77_03485, partial [Thermoguttaceae bacterium]